jgi:hypothetical protein
VSDLDNAGRTACTAEPFGTMRIRQMDVPPGRTSFQDVTSAPAERTVRVAVSRSLPAGVPSWDRLTGRFTRF